MYEEKIEKRTEVYFYKENKRLEKEFKDLLKVRDLEIKEWKNNRQDISLIEWNEKYSLVWNRLRDFHINECNFHIFEKEYRLKKILEAEDSDMRKDCITILKIDIKHLKLQIEHQINNI